MSHQHSHPQSMAGKNFANADLAGKDFRGVELRGANFAGADLRGANLELADLARGQPRQRGAGKGQSFLGQSGGSGA